MGWIGFELKGKEVFRAMWMAKGRTEAGRMPWEA